MFHLPMGLSQDFERLNQLLNTDTLTSTEKDALRRILNDYLRLAETNAKRERPFHPASASYIDMAINRMQDLVSDYMRVTNGRMDAFDTHLSMIDNSLSFWTETLKETRNLAGENGERVNQKLSDMQAETREHREAIEQTQQSCQEFFNSTMKVINDVTNDRETDHTAIKDIRKSISDLRIDHWKALEGANTAISNLEVTVQGLEEMHGDLSKRTDSVCDILTDVQRRLADHIAGVS